MSSLRFKSFESVRTTSKQALYNVCRCLILFCYVSWYFKLLQRGPTLMVSHKMFRCFWCWNFDASVYPYRRMCYIHTQSLLYGSLPPEEHPVQNLFPWSTWGWPHTISIYSCSASSCTHQPTLHGLQLLYFTFVSRVCSQYIRFVAEATSSLQVADSVWDETAWASGYFTTGNRAL